jgi:putative flavoprotein involved in K+ transport
MTNIISKELLIIGGGPAGLRAGMECAERKIDYLIFESGNIAQAWRNVRPEMMLLSPCHPQRDWTSLSSKFPIWKMDVKRPYCSAGEFIKYLDSFTDHYQINIELHNGAKKIIRKKSLYQVTGENGVVYEAPTLLIVTGIFGNPWMPPIDGLKTSDIVIHSNDYRGKAGYRNKKVLIVGGGNSAAEIAIDLAGNAMVYLLTRSRLRFFSKTKKLYHIRGISESYLKELISMELIRHFPLNTVEKIEKKTVHFGGEAALFDQVIFATGYKANIHFLDHFNLRVNKNNFPKLSPAGESVQYPGMFFGGPLAFHSPVSLVMHGFAKQIPITMKRIEQSLKNK